MPELAPVTIQTRSSTGVVPIAAMVPSPSDRFPKSVAPSDLGLDPRLGGPQSQIREPGARSFSPPPGSASARHGRSRSMVLRALDCEQLDRARHLRLRRPQDPEPAGRGHIRRRDGLLCPRRELRVPAPYIDLLLLRIQLRSPRVRPPLLLLPHAPPRLHPLPHRPLPPLLLVAPP